MIDTNDDGKRLGTVRFPIDRSKLMELARALGDEDPVWHDPEAARAAGFDGVPVPPTVTVLADHWRPGGALAMVEALDLDLARVLHGEAEWELLRPLRAGDELTADQRLERVTTREGKRGGTMRLLAVLTEFSDAGGEVVVRRRDTIIERGA